MPRKTASKRARPAEEPPYAFMLGGALHLNLGLLPIAPLVGFADTVALIDRGFFVELGLYDSETGGTAARVTIDLALLLRGVLPALQELAESTSSWLMRAQVAPTPPIRTRNWTGFPVATRISAIRASRTRLEAEIEFYAVSTYAIADARGDREKERPIEFSPVARVQLPTAALGGLLQALFSSSEEWEARVQVPLAVK